MSGVLFRVDSHHLALVHLLHQRSCTQVSLTRSMYEQYEIHEQSSPSRRLAPPAQPVIVDLPLVHLLHQWTYPQVSLSIYEL